MQEYVSEYTFRDRFRNSDTYKHNFTYEGLTALFDYLEALEDDTGEQIEFDMIGLCCEYTEYEDLKEFQDNYGCEFKTIDDIAEVTTVILVTQSDRFIIQDF